MRGRGMGGVDEGVRMVRVRDVGSRWARGREGERGQIYRHIRHNLLFHAYTNANSQTYNQRSIVSAHSAWWCVLLV